MLSMYVRDVVNTFKLIKLRDLIAGSSWLITWKAFPLDLYLRSMESRLDPPMASVLMF